MPFNYTGGYEYLNIKWSISMHLMVYFNASGGSKVSIDGPFEMQYSFNAQPLTFIGSLCPFTSFTGVSMYVLGSKFTLEGKVSTSSLFNCKRYTTRCLVK